MHIKNIDDIPAENIVHIGIEFKGTFLPLLFADDIFL